MILAPVARVRNSRNAAALKHNPSFRGPHQMLTDELPNLQLLEGAANNEKRATMPAAWLAKHFPTTVAARNYSENHLLGTLGDDLDTFDAFYKVRRERLRERLIELLSNP